MKKKKLQTKNSPLDKLENRETVMRLFGAIEFDSIELCLGLVVVGIKKDIVVCKTFLDFFYPPWLKFIM